MKKIGLIGGISWESTQMYYKIINRKVREISGGFHSAKCTIESVDFSEIHALQAINDWNALDQKMVEAATNLKNAQADVILICANTMHLCSDAITTAVDLPLIHIARATGEKIKAKGLSKVLLLGTKFTMERDFFRNILADEFNIEVLIPVETDREVVHNVIYEELVHGKINAGSRGQYVRIIYEAVKNGAEGVILGCTEIPLLIEPEHVSIPTFNTTQIHAEKAVEFALNTAVLN
ncbi:amino acid racemase [Aurantibacter sp.]|uniref:aspartate/glutamate racemase family protein n=1 Tax=Aurantibacter sp. TaxID=2807103 RepID=UPI003267DE68